MVWLPFAYSPPTLPLFRGIRLVYRHSYPIFGTAMCITVFMPEGIDYMHSSESLE